jgi:hypothetical protein
VEDHPDQLGTAAGVLGKAHELGLLGPTRDAPAGEEVDDDEVTAEGTQVESLAEECPAGDRWRTVTNQGTVSLVLGRWWSHGEDHNDGNEPHADRERDPTDPMPCWLAAG